MSPIKESKEPKPAPTPAAPASKDVAKSEPKPDAKANAKPRVYNVAAELNLETKEVLDLCKELGFTAITSQLKALEADQVEAIKARVKRGPAAKAAPAKPAPLPPVGVPAKPAAIPAKVAEVKVPTLAKPKAPAGKPAGLVAEVAQEPVAEVVPVAPERKPAGVSAPQPVAELPTAEVVAPTTTAAPVAEVVPPKPAPPKLPSVMPTRPMNLNNRPANLNSRPANLNPARPAPAAPVPEAPAAVPVSPVEPAPVVAAAPSEPAPAPVASAPAPVVTPPAASAVRPPAPSAPAVAPPQSRPMNMAPNANRPAFGAPPAGNSRPMTNLGAQNRPSGPGSGQGGGQYGPPRPAVPPVSSGGRPAPNPGPPTRMSAPARVPGQPVGPIGQGPRPAGPPSPGAPGAPKSVRLTVEQIQKLRALELTRNKTVSVQDIISTPSTLSDDNRGPGGPVPPGGVRPGGPLNRFPGAPATPVVSDDDRRRGAPGMPATGNADPRAKARPELKGRNDRRPGSYTGSITITGGRVDMIDRMRHRKKHRGPSHQKALNTVIGGKVEIAMPITVRTLSESIGMKAGELLLKLKNLTNSLYTINSMLDFGVAEMVAIERNVELVAKKQESAEDETLRKIREAAEASDDANLTHRPPIVTIMGHVDHGKTSLLDRIRVEYGLTSDVVSTEVGGITQVLRAWRVEKDGKSTTFLDTPGHEAFTKMRARGANVTDIAVIVVSATDGIMPQTAEAVAHAKAADVNIIVAINKCDLPGAQPEKVKNRLYDLELVPEDMGGDVPVIFTSAITGQGVDELLDAISLLAELDDLKADATLPGSGTCLEAYKEEGRGVVATMLVQNGTLRKGDTILCGSTFGRVRAMYDDLANPITEAGPSTPVKFIGLDDVPDADDPFYVVSDVGTAREIAGDRRERRDEDDRYKFQSVSLESLRDQNSKVKVTELKVILKAEARGSLEAIKKELEKLTHEEVRVRLLHAGVGAITESDVQLALTSPADTLMVGFNVTTDDAAMRLASERGISVREYQIIYNLVDDIKAQLEGRLKPIEEVVHLGRAVIRETFTISKVGKIAGCYVTSGTIERSARVRVIRDGVVLYPKEDKIATLDNLKRFKDDAKEVREGFECGMKITGFDDVKVGDVIEAFKIEIKQRTL